MTVASFKAELAVSRKHIEQGEPDDGHRSFKLSLLDRWRDNPDAERSWEAIKQTGISNRTEPPAPGPFINWIIEQSLIFKRVADEVIPRAPGLTQRAERLADKDWKAGRLADAVMRKTAAQDFRTNMTRVLGRQLKDAPRKRFVKLCTEMFSDQCGKPLDSVVAMLATIVCGSDVSIDAVRGAQRSSRRRDRDTRSRK
jgi:hypothetical protein